VKRVEDSEPGPLWFLGLIVAHPVGRIVTVRLADAYDATPTMLLGVSGVALLLAWLADFVVLSGIDS
jgi:hypothetical protein